MLVGRTAVLPAGLIASAFLARVLGPTDFGLFSVAVSIVQGARMFISMLFSRASIKLISETSDWEPVAVALIRIQLLLGVTVGAVTFLAAPALADALGGPALRPVLRVLAVAAPISTLAQAHRYVLNGRRAFRRSALLPLVSDMSRLLLILLLVGAGLGLYGAALAVLGAACAQLWFARRSLRLRLWQRAAIPKGRFLRYSVPLFLDTAAKRLHKRVDLWTVQILAGATSAGYYSAARGFNAAGGVFSQALYPVILATVSDAWAQGRIDAARTVIRQSLRLSLCLVPFAALGAGAAPGLITLVFGDAFLPAAPLLVWVSFSIVALVIINVTTAVFAAVGRPGSAFAFNGPLLVVAVVGYLVLVPRIGAVGAAATTAVTTWGVAVATMAAVYRWCQVGPSLGTVARATVTSAAAYGLARLWHAPGAWVVPQLLALSGVVLLLLWILGEVQAQDIRFAVSLLKHGGEAQDVEEGGLA
jgi:O-antigen/teichoic acid export membrane protein